MSTPENAHHEERSTSEEMAEAEQLPEPSVQFVGVIEEGTRRGDLAYDLAYGSKKTRLYCGPIYNYFLVDTYVEKIEGAEKLPDETSILYERVNQLCQMLSNANNKQVRYHFKTQYPQMARWALSKGNEIFHWNRMSTFNGPGGEGKILSESDEFKAERYYDPETPVSENTEIT